MIKLSEEYHIENDWLMHTHCGADGEVGDLYCLEYEDSDCFACDTTAPIEILNKFKFIMSSHNE